jgi:citronellol/citronellal dehydrogenase
MKRLELLAGQIVANTGKLKGKTVVVTGGSRGIGLAIVRKCAKDGANVAILAKND